MSGIYRAEYNKIVRQNYKERLMKERVKEFMEFREVLLVEPKTFVEWFRDELEEIGYEELMEYLLPEDYNRIAEILQWPKLETPR